MDAREQRGLVIAALCRLNRDGNEWLVPSQSDGDKLYRVNPEAKTCTCLDHTDGGHVCKHIRAVEITIKRETRPDGTIVETQSVTFTEEKTYKQNWPAYGLAQRIEKDRLQELLFDLCRGLPGDPEVRGRGRPAHNVRDSIFAMVFKTYSTFSARRFESDLREAYQRGHMSRIVGGLKVCHFMENPEYTPILKELVRISALPLRAVETDFAIDSSGFSSCKFDRWYDEKYGCHRQRHSWVKAHIACGVKTNVVTAIRILDKDAGDSPQFLPLVRETSQGFQIEEVSADKAYASLENFEAVADCGGTGFIAFREGTTGAKGGLFERMFHYFQFRRDEFLSHYHKRSNVESTFSMIKRKFGDSVRSRDDVAMVNEVLCKVIAHNLCCLIQEQCELGIVPVFWEEPKEEQPAIDVEPQPVEEYDFAELAFV